MATFTTTAGVLTLEFLMTDNVGWVSLFPSKKNVVEKSIPFVYTIGSSSITQFLGQDNPKEKFTVVAPDDTTAAALEAAWKAMLPGTLDMTTEFGTGPFIFGGVYITDVSAKRRLPWEALWEIDITMTQYA